MQHSGQLKKDTTTEQTQAPSKEGPEVAADWFVDPVLPTQPREQTAQTSEQITTPRKQSATDGTGTVTSLDQAPSRRITIPDPAQAPEPQRNPQEGAAPEAASDAGAPEAVWLGIPTLLPGNAVEGELAWQVDALCAQTDPEAFFPEKGGSTREAKKVCAACTVKQECLDYALSNDERFGIWGGLSERERRKLKRRTR